MFVSAAYAATWLAIVAYWVHVHRTLGRARRAFESATAAGAGHAAGKS